MSEKYSIIFQPPAAVIEQVQQLKSDLAEVIGWYASRHAAAHITIQEFVVDPRKIDLISRQLQRYCASLTPVAVCLNRLDSFPNGAFFIQPDPSSRLLLAQLMKGIQQAVPTPNTHRGTEPHLTIGRRLSFEKLLIAREVIATPNIRFSCDTVALRRFNPLKKQFEIVAEFPFLGLPSTQEIQGSLF
ncbi:2'-5' RNA ligase family protein [Flavobacterium sp. JP2137]|uniref:2'-5' RNA ligase family protein n=1 Tax=Flavobacterium sp. JP2137 TaxID=3414510 RepID=UPI003D2FD262